MKSVETTINDRIKILRKGLKITQTEFGNELGVTYAAVSRMELAKSIVTESNIKLICSVFGVSEEWLRNGTGEMFLNNIDVQKENTLLNWFRQLPGSGQDLVVEYAENLVFLQKKMDNAAKSMDEKKLLEKI